MVQALVSRQLGTIVKNVRIPNTKTGGFWPHLTDFFVPVIENLAGAFVVLHGGTGTKEYQARVCGLTKKVANVASRDVRWNSLVNAATLFAFPQGQACTGITNEWNPFGVDTRQPEYPNGVFVWSNGDFYSQNDDPWFLDDLAGYIQDTYGVPGVNLAGHSQGGIMAMWMWWRADHRRANWRRFVSSAGPRPLDLPAVDASPHKRPLLMQIGNLDTEINVAAGTFFDEKWFSVRQSRAAHYPLGPIRYGFYNDLQAMVDAYNTRNSLPPETVSILDGVITSGTYGNITKFTYGGGKILLEHHQNCTHKPATIAVNQLLRPFTKWLVWAGTTPV